jgi:hypothetical protein
VNSELMPDEAPRGEPLPPWPFYGPAERAAVDAVLASGKVNYWTGSESRQFEEEYARYLGVEHAIALANGTVALELPLRMWNIGSGDEVIVTPRSFIASTSCAVAVGARPVFADVDRDSGNITAETIARVLTPRTRAIIPVHLAGWPCDRFARTRSSLRGARAGCWRRATRRCGSQPGPSRIMARPGKACTGGHIGQGFAGCTSASEPTGVSPSHSRRSGVFSCANSINGWSSDEVMPRS